MDHRPGAAEGQEAHVAVHRSGEKVAFPEIWDHAETADGPLDSFALLTSAPGPDQAAYHNRQPAILEREQWSDWLDVKSDMAPTFRGSPAGTIAVEWFTEAPAQATLGF